MAKNIVKGKCRVCGGSIVEKVVHEFDPSSGPAIIGPGSQHQFHEVSKGFHCSRCGIKYKFVPKSKK